VHFSKQQTREKLATYYKSMGLDGYDSDGGFVVDSNSEADSYEPSDGEQDEQYSGSTRQQPLRSTTAEQDAVYNAEADSSDGNEEEGEE